MGEDTLRLSAGTPLGSRETVQSLMACNGKTARFGLTLLPEQMTALAAGRARALQDTGRVEFGEGILPQLILTFCDAPDLHQADYAAALLTLQEVFYHLKNETRDQIPDRELLALVRKAFDQKARGAADLLAGWSLAEWLEQGAGDGE